MRHTRFAVLAIIVSVVLAGCDATRITADAPNPPCSDFPTMGSGC